MWKCKLCKKIFTEANSNVLECEKCSEHFCAKCCNVNDTEYAFMTTRKDIHWFCTGCDALAMESVISDKDLEAKINMNTKALTQRFLDLENELTDKVDKKEYDNRMEKFTDKNLKTKSNMKLKIQEIKNTNTTFENDLVEVLKSLVKLKNDFEDKINEDATWAKVVSRSIDEILLHV